MIVRASIYRNYAHYIDMRKTLDRITIADYEILFFNIYLRYDNSKRLDLAHKIFNHPEPI